MSADSDTYTERRVRVSTYGALPAKSPLLVAVPCTAGTMHIHVLAAKALARMSAATERDLGLALKIASGWRAHRWKSREEYEETLIRRYGSVKEGRKWLGFESPHETGLAIDIGVGGLKPDRKTVVFQRKQPLHAWMIAHAWEYGWHPYKVEPWHWELPVSVTAFRSGEVREGDAGPPDEPLSFGEEEELALEDEDLGEEPDA